MGRIVKKLLCIPLLILAIAAAPRKSERVVVILPEGCTAACSCLALAQLLPGGDEADCVEAQSELISVSEDGCCGATDVATCPGDPDGCVMGSKRIRVRLSAAFECECEKADISTGGVDAGQSQTGLTVADGWSQWFTVGGFGLYCSGEGIATTGSLSVTCTSGGTPTPRELAKLLATYDCNACGG